MSQRYLFVRGHARLNIDQAFLTEYIAGGGPIGLTLGLELSARGVPCVVVERVPVGGFETRACQ